MNKYAYILCACCKYLPELVANLNSLDAVGNTHDVHFWGYKIPSSVVEQCDKLCYKVIFHDVTLEEMEESQGVSEVMCRKRYLRVWELSEEYDAVCVLDADLVWTADPTLYFKIAADTGLVLGPSKEQNKVYDHEHHMFNGEFIIPKGTYNPVDMCNCPLFVDPKIWGECLKKSWDIFITDFPNFRAPDMDAMNICLLEAGSADKTVVLPGIAWLGTNEQMLKPYMRVVKDRDRFKTENGIPVFCYHGQYYHHEWKVCQLENRHRCAEGYLGCSEKCDNMAKGVMQLLADNFYKMLRHKIIIEEKDWRHIER